MSGKIGVYLSMRNKASRLPGKSLLPFGGQPLVQFMLGRIKDICGAEAVVLCTSNHPEDAVLTNWADVAAVASFRGSQDDKLRRYLAAADHFGHELLLIVDGDDPFVSVAHARRTMAALQSGEADMVLFDNLPVGAMVFGIRADTLRAAVEGLPERDTEVWAPFVRQLPGLRERTLYEDNPTFLHPLARMTVDYPEDYAFCVAVLDALKAKGQAVSFENIMALLHAEPDLVALNAHKAADYERNLRKITAS